MFYRFNALHDHFSIHYRRSIAFHHRFEAVLMWLNPCLRSWNSKVTYLLVRREKFHRKKVLQHWNTSWQEIRAFAPFHRLLYRSKFAKCEKSFLFDNSLDGILLLLSRKFNIARDGGQTFGFYAPLQRKISCHWQLTVLLNRKLIL